MGASFLLSGLLPSFPPGTWLLLTCVSGTAPYQVKSIFLRKQLGALTALWFWFPADVGHSDQLTSFGGKNLHSFLLVPFPDAQHISLRSRTITGDKHCSLNCHR